MRNFKVNLVVPENKIQQTCHCTLIPGHTLLFNCTLIISGINVRGIINVQNVVITNNILETCPLIQVISSTIPGRIIPDMINISVEQNLLKITLKNLQCTRESSIHGTLYITQYSHKL